MGTCLSCYCYTSYDERRLMLMNAFQAIPPAEASLKKNLGKCVLVVCVDGR